MLLLAVAVSPVFCCIGAVQVFGVTAAAIARLTEGTRHEACGQYLCLGALAVVGSCCGIAIPFGPHAAAGSAAALAVMTLIAVADFSSPSQ
jgi:hypothetical protein